MKYSAIRYLIFLNLLLLTARVQASPLLLITHDVAIVSTNGLPPAWAAQSKTKQLRLHSGINRIAIVVADKANLAHAQLNNKEPQMVTIISFYAQGNQSYRLRYLKQSNNKLGQNGHPMDSFFVIDSDHKSAELQSFNTVSNDLISIHQLTKPKLAKQAGLKIISSKPLTNHPKSKPLQSKTAKQMLLIWWSKANQQEREEFLAEIQK